MKILKYFRILIFIIALINTQKLIYYPEDFTGLDMPAPRDFVDKGEVITAAYYFAQPGQTTVFLDFRNGMRIFPYSKVNLEFNLDDNHYY
jgi:hypothetical protein